METETTEIADTVEAVANEYCLDEDAFEAYCYNFHITENLVDSVEDFQDAYVGLMSAEEYAEQLADDIFPEAVKSGYFDYDKFANDLLIGGDIWEYQGHLFRSI